MNLEHIHLTVNQLDQGLKFYREVKGSNRFNRHCLGLYHVAFEVDGREALKDVAQGSEQRKCLKMRPIGELFNRFTFRPLPVIETRSTSIRVRSPINPSGRDEINR